MSRTIGTMASRTSSWACTMTSTPSSTGLRSASVTIAATSINASRARSSPVISQSIHTSAPVTEADAIRLLNRRPVEAIMAPTKLGQSEIDEKLASLAGDWTGSPEKLRRKIAFADFPTAVEFVVRLAPRCEELDHHPDLRLVW